MTVCKTKISGHEKRELLVAALFALAALAVVLYVRIRLLNMSFERDEGEFAYSGQLILKGFPPYLHAYTMKLPGMAYLSALFMLCFGESIRGLHLGLLLTNSLSAFLLFSLARKLFGAISGLLSAGVFVLLTVSQHLLGAFAHATHFVVLFVLAGSLLAVSGERSYSRARHLFAGLMLGLAFLIKQHAALFLLSLLLFLTLDPENRKKKPERILLMLAGFALPYALVLLLSLRQGVFATFKLWTVSYASAYATGLTPILGWMNFKAQLGEILGSTGLFWAIAAAGLLALAAKRSKRGLLFCLPFLLCSLAAISPGFHFRPHYFILLAPAVSLLAGSLYAPQFLPKTARAVLAVAFFTAFGLQLRQEGWFLFGATPEQYLKKAYQTTKPFAESAVVAAYVKSVTAKDDRILVLGSEPQIYFYADRLSATGHIYMYPLMEQQPYALPMQDEMLRQVTASKPAYLVLVDDLSSWLAISKDGERFRERLADFMKNRYELDGVASVSRENESFYVFGERARQIVPDSPSRILVYRLKKELR